jgi:hypothetical protein
MTSQPRFSWSKRMWYSTCPESIELLLNGYDCCLELVSVNQELPFSRIPNKNARCGDFPFFPFFTWSG